jgi:flagellar protein FlaG
MTFSIPPVGGAGQPGPAPRTQAPQTADFGRSLEAAVNVNTLPASPPASVLEAMNSAAEAAEKLRAQGRELHFEPTGTGRVVIQVRDLDGNVIRTIPPHQALEVASGARLD